MIVGQIERVFRTFEKISRSAAHQLRAVITAFYVIGALSGFLQAQNYLTTTGSPSFASPYPAEMGTVDAASGNLHLEIPLGSFPQRGTSASLVSKLVYDSHIWVAQFDATTQSEVWTILGLGMGISAPRTYGTWGFEAGNSSYLIATGDRYVISNGHVTSCETDYLLWDSSGTQHYFPIVNTTPAWCPWGGGNAYATDSSGYRLSTTGSASGNTSVLVNAPDGTLVYSLAHDLNQYIMTEDSNGNYLYWNGTVESDTVGRSISTAVFNSQDTTTGTSNYTVNTTTIPVKTNFQQTGITECNSNCTAEVIQSIVLPDTSTYTFLYDCDSTTGNTACGSPGNQTAGYYGTLTSMTLPTGETITYAYKNFKDAAGNISHWLTGKTSGTTTIWSYTPTVTSNGGWKTTYPCAAGSSVDGCQQVSVTRPDFSKEVTTFAVNNGAWPITIQSYDTDGVTLLSAVQNAWDFSQACILAICYTSSGQENGSQFVHKTSMWTTLPVPGGGSITKKTSYAYDSPHDDNLTSTKEWAFRSGTVSTAVFPSVPDRASYATYATIGTNNNISRPLSQTECSNSGTDSDCPGGGTKIAQTKLTYDAYGTNNSLALLDVPTAVNHDDTAFGSAYTTRGNATQISQWVSGTTYLKTSYSYDVTGQVIQVVDPELNITTYSYQDAFYQDTGANPPPPYNPPATNAYATTVTDQIGMTSTGYYYGSGKIALTKDYNGVATYQHYLDPLDRETETNPPFGWSLKTYTSPTQFDIYQSVGDTAAKITCNSCVHMQAQLDSLGRVASGNFVNNPAGEVSVNNIFDGVDQIISSSHPHFQTGDPNNVVEKGRYDGLNRPLGTMHPDTQTTQIAYGAAVAALGGLATQQGSTSIYGVGFPVLTVDEAGNKRQRWFDGFGRVIEVDEPSVARSLTSPLVTNYTYDGLGNLAGVFQGVQSRSYVYDGLSRLTTAKTPEASTGTIENPLTISYTTSSGLCSGDPSNPCTRTDPNGVTTTYLYDAANRLTSRTYSSTTTGSVSFKYGINTYAIGRLLKMTDPTGSATYTYDKMGRVAKIVKVVSGTSYSIAYKYNAAGQLTQITYPSGRIVQYSYDNVGHLCAVAPVTTGCSTSTTPYLTIQSYDAANSPLSASYGNGVAATVTYDPMSYQLSNVTYAKGATTLFSLNYYYQNAANCSTGNALGNNGQIQCITDTVQSGRNLSYSYDPLGRLGTASSKGSTAYPAWGVSEAYDRYGNRTAQTVTAGHAFPLSLTINPANNQITSPLFVYDASGNVKSEPSPFSVSYGYDGENCLTSYAGTNTTATYGCDGDGLRVSKVVTGTNAITTISIYSEGQVIAEYDNGAPVTTPTREYVYGNNLLATIVGSTGGAGGTITYQHSDHLSPRLFTDANGNDVTEQGTDPFGNVWYQTSAVPNEVFTSYERDKESGMDYALARSYASNLGRFISPDPVNGMVSDPQSLNRYAYGLNDPINNADPTGLGVWSDIANFFEKLLDSIEQGNPDFFSPGDQDALCDPGLCFQAQADLMNGASSSFSDPFSGTASASTTQSVISSSASNVAQVGKDTAIGGTKGLGNIVIDAANIVNRPIDAALSTFTTFRFGQMAELEGSTPGEKSAMAGVFLLSFADGVGEERAALKIQSITADAEKLYPKLSGKFDLHHVIPKYLGGAEDGMKVRIPRAYHQLITNEFRRLAPYGQKVKPTAEAVANIMREVYTKYPITF